MEGLEFVRGNHLNINGGMFLPDAEIPAMISNNLHVKVAVEKGIKQYIKNMIEVDIFLLRDIDKFILFVSSECNAHIPARGVNKVNLTDGPIAAIVGKDAWKGCEDISQTDFAIKTFENLGFIPGIAIAGRFPSGHTPEDREEKNVIAEKIANLVVQKARKEKDMIENSKIFLSHRGVDKVLVNNIDIALRLIGLNTWFDTNELSAGSPLVRAIDDAFLSCSAAVFFISASYTDEHFIAGEIDRALTIATSTPSFRVIPLVLTQHGGTDGHVPRVLNKLVWKSVTDVEIVPKIIQSLSPTIQKMICYRSLT